MLHRFASLAAVGLLSLWTAPLALADPADPNAAPAGNATPPAADTGPVPEPPNGPVPSAPPGVLNTPDGWVLNVVGKDESMAAVASLTNSPWSRE